MPAPSFSEREAEIRYWLAVEPNDDPSCLSCNEHVMLAEIDRLTAAHQHLLDQLRATFGPGGNSRWTSLLYRWARGLPGPDPMWHVDEHPEALALWNALTGGAR
jgi:hypothetical protein